ncbi:hypothetical protein [Glycomyces tritici]|uniref:Uncharacterized protein n=1 Tax=Glycomyces tritici TaxID=2665176 RepID=A0ABT7YYW3_9ACTN|nr:hypothetical protein [Glycomyces tritici]MDN3243837.1 hypothetical protein [Glycomyces tritici]
MGIERYFLNENGLQRYEADDQRHWKQWEDAWKQRHPCRGRILGIPAQGPD